MPTYPCFGFIDESGVLSNDPNQRFFALGLLLVEDVARLHEELIRAQGRAVGAINTRRAAAGLPALRAKDFEYKFAEIKAGQLPYYRELIDVAFGHGAIRVCVFVIDKLNPKITVGHYFSNTWDAYRSYSCLVVNKNVVLPEQCIVLADYLSRPLSSPHYLEHDLMKLGCVVNASTLESHASLLIQLVDVMSGSVVYHYKQARVPHFKPHAAKLAVADHVAARLSRPTLADCFTATAPVDFSVWEFQR